MGNEKDSATEDGKGKLIPFPKSESESRIRIKKERKKADGWQHRLARDRFGNLLPTLGNAVSILQNEDKWQGVFAFDLHTGRVRRLRQLPTHSLDRPSFDSEGPYIEDADVREARLWIERLHELALNQSTVADAIEVVARAHATHPIREYLEGVKWDGKKRLDKWLTNYVAVDDAPHVRVMGAKWMISAVARVFEPGCQVDHVLIIEGEQRGGKSSVLKALCKDEEWFLSTTVELGNKDAYQIIASKWIVEFAELSSVSKAEGNRVKAFVTERINSYRAAYARLPVDQRRKCVFAGTVNPGAGAGYLKDETGGGRWWVVFSNSSVYARLDVGKLVEARDQLWAEAVARYKTGEKWHVEDAETLARIEEDQDERRIQDPVEELAAAFLTRRDTYEEGCSVRQLCDVCGLDPNDIGHSMRAARILSALKWRLRGRVFEVKGSSTDPKRKRVRVYFPTQKSPKPRPVRPEGGQRK